MKRATAHSLVPDKGYPPATKGRIVVWGLLGSRPFGGMIWQVLHHLVGLRHLGYDVWYVEDSLDWLMEPEGFAWTDDHAASAAYLAHNMERVGLSDRWFFRPPEPRDVLYGGEQSALERLYSEADVFLNLCGSHTVTEEQLPSGLVAYIQTDPVTDQIRAVSGDPIIGRQFAAHDVFFSYGENLGAPDCLVPLAGIEWQPTRAPVWLDWWRTGGPPAGRPVFTTIASWHQSHKDLEWQGESYYWDKRREFLKFSELPGQVPADLELSLTGIEDDDSQMMSSKGWRISDSHGIGAPDAYRDYIRSSSGEFTVAKDQNVRFRSGWFSDRSACYLAGGRPVVMQDTGFGNALPTGEGLFAVHTEDEAAAAIDEVSGNYNFHSAAASDIAIEYFAAPKVLSRLLESVAERGMAKT